MDKNTKANLGSALEDTPNDFEFANLVWRFAKGGGRAPTTSPEFAQEIMGKNYLGINEAVKFFGVNPKMRGSSTLAEVPWSEETLLALCDSHVLVATPLLSILNLRTIVRRRYNGVSLFYKQDDYDKMPFAMDSGEIDWRLVRKDPAEKSLGKLLKEQEWLLGATEAIPDIQVMVYLMVAHFLNIGERLLEKTTVRTANVCPDGRRVYIGNFDDMGFDINFYHDHHMDPTLGIGAEQRPWTAPPQRRKKS